MKSSEELEQLRDFSLTVLDELGVSFSEQAFEPLRTTRSLRGLREAARDMVEMCQDLSSEQLAALDARLSAVGLPTLSLMRDRRYQNLLAVLSRGRIESDDEFRLVDGFVSDVAPDHLSPETRAEVNLLLRAYESGR